MPNQPFRLSTTLVGHSQDVKAVKFIKASAIYSCARDTTARVWKKTDEKTNQWVGGSVYQNSNPGFLNAVQAIVFDGKEYIITAGQDALIQIWPVSPEPEQPYQPAFVLAGHTSNVCCLDVAKSPSGNESTIYSGSWDCTAIAWRNNVPLYTMQAHSAAVWAVIGLGDAADSVLTGAADNLIMLWKNGKHVFTFKGHTQAVRALVRLPQTPELFASAGNDATVRIWSLDGQPVRVMDGHDSFIYSLDSLPTGELVSSGEDRTVRLWDPNSGKLTQTVTVPAISVWTVSACQTNGDFACGSSDNMIRVFTRSAERLASSDELTAFEETVKASSVPSATVGDIKKSDLPSVALLLSRRGKKEGEVAMAKNESNGAVEAYQWDGLKGDWSMVGTVVDGIGSSRKQLFEGKEYDYVFDVDIKDGVPPLKLPYSVSENPYTVAQKWLAKHELPDSYVEQIVEFIDKNTSGVSIGGQTSGADPFTGAGSYRPGNSVPNNTQNIGADPFTGAGSYRPNSGANTSTGSVNTKKNLLPHKTFLTFPPTNLNFSGVMGKIKQFNSELAGSTHELVQADFDALESLTGYLTKASNMPPEAAVKVLEKMILVWPVEKQFPAIDLVRIMAITVLPTQTIPALLAKTNELVPSASTELNFTLALRALNNGLSSCAIRAQNTASVSKEDLAKQVFGALWGEPSRQLKPSSKNSKVAFATVFLNLSIMCVDGALDNEIGHRLVSLSTDIIKTETEEEVIYRSLIGLGNLLSSEAIKKKITDQDNQVLKTRFSALKVDSSQPNRLTDAISEIEALLV